MRLRKQLRDKKGQAAVELVLVLPILLLLLCGIIDFGWIFGNKLYISYCSREGARYGITVATDVNSSNLIVQRVMNIAPSYLRSGLTVHVSYSNITDVRNGDVSVDVSCHVNVLTPLGQIFTRGQTVAIDSNCVMKAE